ncbi:MAG: hypothetical protein PUC65_09435 [Clostridiales bacterium]|nr:hypothetical protein [Clostridiales bacterium]
MEEKKSLYNYIEEHLVDGMLPKRVSLPDESANEINATDGPSNQLKFADGAIDGMMIYHMQLSELGGASFK